MKSNKLLNSFEKYCQEHPEERFWQALRNWTKLPFIYGSNGIIDEQPCEYRDTFYWETENELKEK